MLEGRDIICFCNDWDGDPLSKKHVMLGLARKNRILWVNSIGNRNPRVTGRDLRLVVRKARDFAAGCRRVADNIYVFSPLVIPDRKSTRLNSSHSQISYAVFCLKKKKRSAAYNTRC